MCTNGPAQGLPTSILGAPPAALITWGQNPNSQGSPCAQNPNTLHTAVLSPLPARSSLSSVPSSCSPHPYILLPALLPSTSVASWPPRPLLLGAMSTNISWWPVSQPGLPSLNDGEPTSQTQRHLCACSAAPASKDSRSAPAARASGELAGGPRQSVQTRLCLLTAWAGRWC